MRLRARRSPRQTTFFWRLHSAAAQTAGSIQHFLQEPEKNASILGDGLRTRNRMRRRCKCHALHSRSAVLRTRRDPQIILRVDARKSSLQLFLLPPLPLSPVLWLLKVGRTCIQSEPVAEIYGEERRRRFNLPPPLHRGNHAALMPRAFTPIFWFFLSGEPSFRSLQTTF